MVIDEIKCREWSENLVAFVSFQILFFKTYNGPKSNSCPPRPISCTKHGEGDMNMNPPHEVRRRYLHQGGYALDRVFLFVS